jgi:hypothetical protein
LKVYTKKENSRKEETKDKNRTQQYLKKKDVDSEMKLTGQNTAE